MLPPAMNARPLVVAGATLLRLGPMGAHIMGEVFIGLLKADSESYLLQDRDWQPVLPSAVPGQFHVTDLLKFAGVAPPLN